MTITGMTTDGTTVTLVAPVLGTPASGTLTNATGLPAAGVVGTAAVLGGNTFTGQNVMRAGATGAGTAPIKFQSGSLNTTAEAGAIEFLTDAYYATIAPGAARKTFAFLESPSFTTPALGAATFTSLTNTNAGGDAIYLSKNTSAATEFTYLEI